jgi:pimeloyl-ACP methyl ester carboxylesterase
MSVNYEEAGDSNEKTIIFVHGAGGSAATWFMQLRGLSTDYHVVALELNGHGQTPDRAEEDILQSYIHDVHEVVSKFIILVGTGAKLRVTPIVFNLLDNNFEGYVEALGNFMFHEETTEEVIEASKHEVRKCPVQVIRRDFEMCDKFDIMKKVKDITTPTLILVGDADVMTPVKYSSFLKDEIEDSVMHVIEGAGHAVMLEKFGVFNELIANWVRDKD